MHCKSLLVLVFTNLWKLIPAGASEVKFEDERIEWETQIVAALREDKDVFIISGMFYTSAYYKPFFYYFVHRDLTDVNTLTLHWHYYGVQVELLDWIGNHCFGIR